MGDNKLLKQEPEAPPLYTADDVQQGASAPPSYEEAMGINMSSIVEGESSLPPLAYVDIMPRFVTLGDLTRGIPPTFQKFGDIINGANMWLAAHPGLRCWKCETIERRVNSNVANITIDLEIMKTQRYLFGTTVYVIGLRMWLTRNSGNSSPQRLGLLNIVPRRKDVRVSDTPYEELITGCISIDERGLTSTPDVFCTFEGLSQTVERLNKQLKENPLQGSILNVETATLKCSGFVAAEDPDVASYAEFHHPRRASLVRHCQILRLFYVHGKPSHEVICLEQFLPDITRQPGMLMGGTVFKTFGNAITKAQKWIQNHSQGTKIVNIETRDVKVHEKEEQSIIDPDSSDEFESSFFISKYVKMLRLFYVKCPDAPPLSSVTLTSRIFPPLRLAEREFETMSQTMNRIAAWLSGTGLPILSVETVAYPYTDNAGLGINADKADYLLPLKSGKLWITAIRLYFHTYYEEPDPQLLPTSIDWRDRKSSSTCSII